MATKKDKDKKFIEAVDSEMHDSVIHLDQKLRGLQTEIVYKINSLKSTEDEAELERQSHLKKLANEIEQAIDSIDKLVNLVVSDDLTSDEFIKINQESLSALRSLFDDNTQKISEIKEKF